MADDQDLSDEEEEDDEPLMESKRSSSKLGSNFIRFGRGDPSLLLKNGGYYGKAFGFFPDSFGDYPYHQRRYGRSNLNSNFLRFGRR